MKHIQHFIGNDFVDSATGATFESITPIDNSVLAVVAEGGKAEVDLAVAAARDAFTVWSTMDPEDRGAVLHRVADGIEARLEELAEWETRDMGKPITASRAKDMPRSAHNFRFFADFARDAGTKAWDQPAKGVFTYELREPLGVVGSISPWNFPLMLLTWKVAPALAFGCTVVAKPAEQSPITASILAEICRDAGMPPGVFNVVNGFGPDSAGEALTTHRDVDAITFTGESNTGRAIMAAASPTLKQLSFEMGGKSANIVLADADLDAAVAGSLKGIFTNQGEVCLAGSRLMVQRPVYDEFLSRLVDGASEWVIGDPLDPATKMGPLVSSEHLDKVLSYIDLAQEEGAKLLTGGNRVTDGDLAKGNYVAPTIFADADNSMQVCQDEIFGPVEMVMPFDDVDEAIEIANQSRYGLAGMVWTQNLNLAHKVAREVKTGTMWVNCFFVRDLRAPFGGYKESGMGREGGEYSYEFFTEAKAVVMKF
ncbi:MAG: aldehyde dehydrogenase [Actinomycetota bacterium]|nr:aldehyde dehydrogenase [Actinomycetota bacterium]